MCAYSLLLIRICHLANHIQIPMFVPKLTLAFFCTLKYMSSTELPLLGITECNSDASSMVTPPGSVNSSPLTPPASEKFGCNQSSVLDAFRRAQKFQLKDPWNSFDLHPGEYEQALEELALPDNCTLGSFVENKLRHAAVL
jgi:hypothetical protein